MSNTWFKFKQFVVYQQHTSMKVCTDSCLFGAWAADKILSTRSDTERILDIGTGTGLLALMLVQKINAHIDALEIEKDSYQQAMENFNKSKWRNSLIAFNNDIRKFPFSHKYDVIISNPPFFDKSLKSIDEGRNTAKHSTYLVFEDIAEIAYANLTDAGILFILLPFPSFANFEKTANAKNLYV